ncbi:MAG: hypothetical protein K2N29_01600, partial [Ruminiclostridium sp.]|nr:hypothetical protein [Ruminiclostridium sp.]
MNKQIIKRKAAALFTVPILLGGCAVSEVRVQEPDLPIAAYISRSPETEPPALETDLSESAETSEAPAPAAKETEAEPAPRTEPVPKGEITLLGANMVY